MQKQISMLLLCALMATSGVDAAGKKRSDKKKPTQTETPAKAKQSDYDKLFKEKHQVADGMMKLHKMGGKIYIEMPKSLIGREMLLGSVISETSNNLTGIPGSKSYTPMHIVFTLEGNQVQIREMNDDNYTDDSTPANMVRSLGRNNVPTIFRNFKIDAYNNDSTTVVFNATDLFLGHVKELSPFSYLGAYGGSGSSHLSESFKKELSYLNDIKAFSDNICISSTLSYTYSLTNPVTRAKIVSDEPFTAKMTRTIVLLDEKPYRPRITDSRMSVFPTGKYVYDQDEQRVKVLYLANRWRLDPSDMEAWRRGEKVEPKKQIVFYIDPDFPEKWTSAVYEGVNQWNEMFAEAGFKNAIVAKPFPTDDPEFDADNIKYSCIRYAPIPIANAMGPSWVDPRSGEIINATVYVFHDVIKMLNRMLFVQTAQADKRVRGVKIDDEVILDGLRYVIAHEVGHCLGYMHNMSSSVVIPVDSLRSPSFTQKYGTTTSIMDYARFNYVAQPGDMERGVSMTPPRFGIYDKYAVKWLYTPVPDAATIEDEYKVTSDWITKASADSVYRYGKQQFYATIDPRSQMEDLGDDAMKASSYGVKNLKYILSNMNSWVAGQDDDYSFRNSMYQNIINQYVSYMGHVFGNIGGIYLNELKEGDPVKAYSFVPKEKQKRALQFMLEELRDMSWLDNRDLLDKLAMLGSPKSAVRDAIAAAVIAAPMKSTLDICAQYSDDPYTPQECYADISEFVWRPTMRGRKLTKDEMSLQRDFVLSVAKNAGLASYPGAAKKEGIQSSDTMTEAIQWSFDTETATASNGDYTADPFETFASKNQTAKVSGYGSPVFRYHTKKGLYTEYYAEMKRIEQLLRSRVGAATGETKAHYQYLLHNIEKGLKK